MKRSIMHYPVGTLARDGSGIYYFLGTAYRAAHDERERNRREQELLAASMKNYRYGGYRKYSSERSAS